MPNHMDIRIGGMLVLKAKFVPGLEEFLHLSSPTRIAARYSTYTYIYNPPPISNAP